MIAKQTANAEEEAVALADVDIDAARGQRVDHTFAVLKRTCPLDELQDLTERLAKHLGMKLAPLSLTDKAMEAAKAPSSTGAFERRM